MLEVKAFRIIAATNHLERIEVLVKEWSEGHNKDFSIDSEIAGSIRSNVAQSYRAISESASALKTPVTGAAAERAAKKLRGRSAKMTFRELGVINGDIRSRLEDELESTIFLCVNRSRMIYYEEIEKSFENIFNKIPELMSDIIEAGKCFALERYTACAFHLMRGLECAVQGLSRELKISNVEKEWGKLLSEIAEKIKVMEKGAHRDLWSAVHANLYHVKQAWRNATMHPKKTYTEEEAEGLFSAMKNFLMQLSELIPDSLE